jgi:S1-C subfamily serine protease
VIGRLAPAAVAAAGLAGCASERAPAPPATPPRVVAVRVATLERSGEHATAFALGRGRLVTVAHVVRDGRPVFAAHSRARVLRADRRLDVAVLKVPGVRGPAVRRAPAPAGGRVAVRVIRDGRPRSLRATLRRRILARVADAAGRVRTRPALELGAAVLPGDSGAPVLDGQGRVIGVLFAQASGRPAVAYAVDASALGSILGPVALGSDA